VVSNNALEPTPTASARTSLWLLARLTAGDGADASRRAIGAADGHPLSIRRFAPAIKRLQRTVRLVSKLTAAPPLIRSAVGRALTGKIFSFAVYTNLETSFVSSSE